MLYAIVFICGAVLMSLEMVGSRILAPTFGSSIYIWGSLISTVMAALTLGYYLGGKLADRYPTRKPLGLILATTGFLIGSLPSWSAAANWHFIGFGPQAGSLLASLTFFFIPGLFLAMISPYSIRLATRNLTSVGFTAGRLSAISSAGSIVGTLLTSFFLIPSLGIRSILYLLGGILLLLALVLLTPRPQSLKERSNPLPILILLLLGSLVYSWIFIPETTGACSDAKVLMFKDTLYHRVIVDQIGSERHLHFDNTYQSALDLDNPNRLVFDYLSYLHLAAVAQPAPQRVLFIGLGGGQAPTSFLKDYPSIVKADAVEIDPEVARAARQYFGLPQSPRLETFTQDGRLFVTNAAAKIKAGQMEPYDIVIVDAFNSDNIPYHLTTQEFHSAVKQILAPDGVVAMNIIGSLTGNRLVSAMTRTANTVYPKVYLFPIGGWGGLGDNFMQNIILVATNHSNRWSTDEWVNRSTALMNQGTIKEQVADYAQKLVDYSFQQKMLQAKNIPVLTDDYAPTDTLLHKF